MNLKLIHISLGLIAVLSLGVETTQAQQSSGQVGPVINGQMVGGDPGPGRIMRYPGPKYNMLSAATDFYHPHPMYAHTRGGIDATRTHNWNSAQSTQYSWHGDYYHPQWGKPLALVVPPTASTQSVYSWGVGRTQSVPIYHQYSREYPATYGAAGGMFRHPPYWPTNTQQFGIYYVRGPW